MPTLSDVAIRKMEVPARGRRLVFDDHKDAPKGFGLRVTAAGKRAFVLRYLTAAGKDRLLTIGEHPTWTLTAARKRGADLRRDIDDGVDILEQRREEKAEPTVADVAERFLRTKRDRKSYREIEAVLQNHLLPAIGKKKIRDVRRRDVIAQIEPLAESRPRMAGILSTYTKQLFAYAEDREIIEANPVASLKPERLGQGLTSRQRGRVLSDDEIRALWCLESPPGMHQATLLALKLILVTGQRPGEVAGMRWAEVDGARWTIPAERRGKTETAHSVPLTDTALAILAEAKGHPEHVFSARGRPLGPGALAKAVRRCAEALGSTEADTWGHWRPHDLRRTMRTGLAAAGVSEVVAEAAIGHTRKGVAAVYDLHRYETEKRAALEAWERRLLRIAEGAADEDKVVSIAAAKA
ncbi:MAG: tyrosine-type recombinase/integrase [Pseudomonadota bacterium]